MYTMLCLIDLNWLNVCHLGIGCGRIVTGTKMMLLSLKTISDVCPIYALKNCLVTSIRTYVMAILCLRDIHPFFYPHVWSQNDVIVSKISEAIFSRKCEEKTMTHYTQVYDLLLVANPLAQ